MNIPQIPLKRIYYIFTPVLVVFLFYVFVPFTIVDTGHRGLVTRFGAVDRILLEGIHWKIPLFEQVREVDVRTTKLEVKTTGYSKDLQVVESTLALNYHLNPEAIGKLFQEVGLEYELRIIDPALQESFKAVAANFTAQELIEQRPRVKEQIRGSLVERLGLKHVVVDDFSITDFAFSDQFETAVEAKQKAQQDALRAENELKKVQFEAEQRVTQAKAEAEAIRIQAQAITQQGGSNYVQLKATEKWDGKLPVYMLGDTVPFLNLK